MGRRVLLMWSHFLALACAGIAHAETPLFTANEVLDIELRGPLEATLRDTDERAASPFQLRVGDRSVDVAVRVRGKSRAEVCSFPPLRIDFDAVSAADTAFAGQDRLKLVTHCRSSPGYDLNVLEEYAAYRMFEMLSTMAYRTRLLRVRYVDTTRPDAEPLVRHAFLLESPHELAARQGGELLNVPHVVKDKLDLDQAARVFVFHYLIASTDWSLVTADDDERCCHNIDLVRQDGRDYAVPYDFDLAGLVAPRYARRSAKTGVSSRRDRRYRGYCIDTAHLVTAIAAVRAREADFQALLRSLPGRPARDVTKHSRFLEDFFDEAADPASLAAAFDRACIDR